MMKKIQVLLVLALIISAVAFAGCFGDEQEGETRKVPASERSETMELLAMVPENTQFVFYLEALEKFYGQFAVPQNAIMGVALKEKYLERIKTALGFNPLNVEDVRQTGLNLEKPFCLAGTNMRINPEDKQGIAFDVLGLLPVSDGAHVLETIRSAFRKNNIVFVETEKDGVPFMKWRSREEKGCLAVKEQYLYMAINSQKDPQVFLQSVIENKSSLTNAKAFREVASETDLTRGLLFYVNIADMVEANSDQLRQAVHGQSAQAADTMESLRQYSSAAVTVDPDSPDFRIRNCRTLHDITRYCHERSVQEMFNVTLDDVGGQSGKRLWAGVATQFWVVDLDDGFSGPPEGKFIRLENIASVPMLALWQGISAVPWEGPPTMDAKGFMSIVMQATTNPALNVAAPSSYANRNYFLVSKDFCNLQSRFGFHFSTVEALLGDRAHANYLNFRFKGGAADLSRRRRRADFIRDILERVGFSVRVTDDSLAARVEGGDREHMSVRLRVLGYLTMHTRQLDMIMHDPAASAAHKRRLLDDIATKVAPELARQLGRKLPRDAADAASDSLPDADGGAA